MCEGFYMAFLEKRTIVRARSKTLGTSNMILFVTIVNWKPFAWGRGLRVIKVPPPTSSETAVIRHRRGKGCLQQYKCKDLEEGGSHFTSLCSSSMENDSVPNINILELFEDSIY